ncbi:MAG: EMC3/TMCO1 family protein [Candidatus Thermoplasmatota archaeon]
MLKKLDERLAKGEISEEVYNEIVSRYKSEEDIPEDELEDIVEEEKEKEKEDSEKEKSPDIDGETEDSSSTKPLFSLKRFVYIFLGLSALFIMFQPDLRNDLGKALGTVLYPVIGFEGKYPILTLMLAGSIMITFSTVIRDQMMDWVEMAENQKISSKFNKKLMQAKRANKQTKVKKMEKKQEEISKLSMKSFKPQLKSMAVTMVFILTIFGWIWTFVGGLSNTMFSVPWAFSADLSGELPYCFMPFPMWIGVYMLVSLPLTQVLMVVLKMYDFNKRLKEEEDLNI